MTLLADLEEFVTNHRPHGTLVPAAGPATPHGYQLDVPCPCGVTFMRWVTPDEAALDLAMLHLRNGN